MNSYKYHPKERKDLRKLIEQRIKEEGNEVDLNDIDVSEIIDMSRLFENLNFNGDISNWDVSKVIYMTCMFYECKKFNGDISKWNVSKVKDMNGMFYDCKSFNQDLSKWNVSKVDEMEDIFDECLIKDEYKPKFNN